MKQCEWPFDVPAAVRASRLLAQGGHRVFTGLFADSTLADLAAEAAARRPEGQRTEAADSFAASGRGGSPARAYRCGAGGALQWTIYGSSEVAEIVSEMCGFQAKATGGGTYSYYERPGDFLALHRDILTCDVALITCVSDNAPDAPTGTLRLYPEFAEAPLTAVREAEGVAVSLSPGESIVMLGGFVPHEVTALGEGRERVVSVMCYRVLP